MKKVVIFGSQHWGGCGLAKEYLSEKGIKFAYLDIGEGLFNLKLFLKYRDNSPEFQQVRESGRVGLPCIVINDGERIVFDYTTLDMEDFND